MAYSSGVQPAGTKIGDFEFDGKNYDLWLKKDHNNSGDSVSWTVYSLISKNKQLAGSIDVIGLINKLVSLGYPIDVNEYITVVEFGNETFGTSSSSVTSGTTWINDYSVVLEKK